MVMDTTQYDKEQVLALHRKWWKANVNLDIPPMQECFPVGDGFFMFNRNGFSYFSVDELTTLWEWFHEQGYERYNQTTAIVRFEVRGDFAWIAANTTATVKSPGEEPTENKSRSTEIYYRDRGDGTPEWRMWHFHASAHHPESFPRQAFTETLEERGLEWSLNPTMEPIVNRFGYAD
jgi:hypothetical protein